MFLTKSLAYLSSPSIPSTVLVSHSPYSPSTFDCDRNIPQHVPWKNGSLFVQLGGVVVLEEPLLGLSMWTAVLHEELLIITANGHAAIWRFMVQLFGVDSISPELKWDEFLIWDSEKFDLTNLISFSTVARIQNNIRASKVQARFVASNLAGFAEHPILLEQDEISVVSMFVKEVKRCFVSSKNYDRFSENNHLSCTRKQDKVLEESTKLKMVNAIYDLRNKEIKPSPEHFWIIS